MWKIKSFPIRFRSAAAAVVATVALCAGCAVPAAPTPAKVGIDAGKTIRKVDRRKLIGTNMGLWNYPTRYWNPTTEKLLKAWCPGLVRIPGGSWSDEYFWNGNGVMKWIRYDFPGGGGYELQKKIDTSKFKDGKWQIDYSGYAPGFRINKDGTAAGFHGNFDVKRMFEYIKNTIGTKALITVNAGTGTAKMAAEWVKWANKKEKYGVEYWEVGNELEGGWEMGHYLPDKSEMTGKLYAKKFAEFAEAMKKMDPTIKVGGPASGAAYAGFSKALLKNAGENVDFISFHHYPEKQSLVDDDTLFGRIFEFDKIIAKIRAMIKKYQPERADEIEIGVTEWNCKLTEGRQTGDMTTGLWTCLFIGEMMKTSVDFANQWDIFTQKEKGGHCALHFTRDGRIVPKSQYWAFWLWSNHMGDELLSSTVSGNGKLHSIATRRADGWISVMLVNLSRTERASATLDFKGFNPAERVDVRLFSRRSYLWNYLENAPEWSRPPIAETAAFPSEKKPIVLPPFSAVVLEIPPAGTKPEIAMVKKEIYPDVNFIVPKNIQVGRKAEAWALYREMGDGRPIPSASKLELKVTRGKAKITPAVLDMRDAAAKFTIEALEPGHITICGWMGVVSIDDPPDDPPIYIKATPVVAEPRVFWTFENDKEPGKIGSNWKAVRDDKARRQNTVVAVRLKDVVPKDKKNVLLRINKLPHEFPREDIIGFVAEVFVSPDFKAPPGAKLLPVLQSRDAYWIPLKPVELSKISKNSDDPTKISVKVPEKFLPAMKNVFEIRFLLDSSQPISGTLYFDNIGFLMEQ